MAEAMSKADLETETRVSVLETQVDTITESVSKLEQKIDANYATLHHRISDMRDDLRGDIDAKHEKIIDKLDAQNKTSTEQHKAIADKISSIEKWRYMMVGGAMVMGYFLAHIKLEKLI
jgi:predicted  nucleic acid-binding Zn-ribbon protein